MNPPDEPDDELLREYRRAGAEEAGPSATTRKAILAHARAVALQRRPAANDHRFAWRAVAGVAVLGVAVLVWRQVDRPLAPLAPPVAQAPAKAPEPFAEPQAAPPPSTASTRAGAPPMPPLAARTAPAPPVADEPAPALAARAMAKQQASQDRSLSANVARDVAEERARQAPAAFSVAALSDAQRLQIYFPSAYANATAGTRLWLLEDANGEVLQSGSLAAQETLDDVAQRIRLELPGRAVGSWRVVPVSNAQGTSLQLGIARLQ